VGCVLRNHFNILKDNGILKKFKIVPPCFIKIFPQLIVFLSDGRYHLAKSYSVSREHYMDTDLANETFTLAGNTTNGFTGTYTIGITL
jgi:hypothetical protein